MNFSRRRFHQRLFQSLLALFIAFNLQACFDKNNYTASGSGALGLVTTSNVLTISASITTTGPGGTVTLQASGGSGNYFFSVLQGSGTLSTVGSTSVFTAPPFSESDTIQLSDSQSAPVTVKIYTAPAFSGTSAYSVALASTVNVSVAGGLPPYTYHVVKSSTGTFQVTAPTNSTSNVFTAPSANETDIVSVSDSSHQSLEVTVLVGSGANPSSSPLSFTQSANIILPGGSVLLSGTGGSGTYKYQKVTGSGGLQTNSNGSATYTATSVNEIAEFVITDTTNPIPQTSSAIYVTVESGPYSLVVAAANSALTVGATSYYPANVLDGNASTCYKSNPITSTSDTSEYLQTWMATPQSINYLIIQASVSDGAVVGFPATYSIQVDNGAQPPVYSNLGTFSIQPNATTGLAFIPLGNTYKTGSITIKPLSWASAQVSTNFTLCDMRVANTMSNNTAGNPYNITSAKSGNTDPGQALSNLYDSNPLTFFATNAFENSTNSNASASAGTPGTTAAWIQAITASPVSFRYLILTALADSNGVVSGVPPSFILEYTAPNTTTWIEIGNQSWPTSSEGAYLQTAVFFLNTSYLAGTVDIYPNTLSKDNTGVYRMDLVQMILGNY